MSSSQPNPRLWKELHCIQLALQELTGNDPFLAQQIRDGLLAARPGDQINSPSLSTNDLVQGLQTLCRQWDLPPVGLEVLDVSAACPCFSPLWLQATALPRLHRMAPFSRGVLLVSQLVPAVRGNRSRWSPTTRQEYAEALHLLRELARQQTRPSAQLHLLVLS